MECRGLDAYRRNGAAWQAVDLNECTSSNVLVYQGGTLRDSVHGH